MRFVHPIIASAYLLFGLTACVTAKRNLCAEGGQPPRDSGVVGKGTKQCVQQKVPGGRFVNHGKYIEWHPNGQRALEGEYASGNKNGKWIEWDEKGKIVSEKWYENGALVPDRNSAPGTAGAINGSGSASLKPYDIERAPAAESPGVLSSVLKAIGNASTNSSSNAAAHMNMMMHMNAASAAAAAANAAHMNAVNSMNAAQHSIMHSTPR